MMQYYTNDKWNISDMFSYLSQFVDIFHVIPLSLVDSYSIDEGTFNS